MMMKKIKSVFLISSILILCLFLSSCETKKQKDERDLSNFISIDLQGTENNGFVKIDFDKDNALEKVTKNLKLDEKNNKYELIELNSLFDSVKINPITKTTNLKNGDIVRFDIAFDKNILKKYNLLLDEKGEFEVSGLNQAKEIDIFNMIDVSFKGVSPKILGEIKNKSTDNEFFNSVKFEFVQPQPFKSGQTVEVRAIVDEALMNKSGFKINKRINSYKVENLPKYAENIKEIKASCVFNQYYQGYKQIQERLDSNLAQTLKSLSNDKYREEDFAKVTYEIYPVTVLFTVNQKSLLLAEDSKEDNNLISIYQIKFSNNVANINYAYVSAASTGIQYDKINDKNLDIENVSLSDIEISQENLLKEIAKSTENHEIFKIADINKILKK